MKTPAYQKAIKLLESDVLKHLATLKYLSLYRNKDTRVQLIEDNTGWPVLSSFPTSKLSFDREAYPKAKVAVFINGTNDKCKLGAVLFWCSHI